MREILFRGKFVCSHKWAEGSLIITRHKAIIQWWDEVDDLYQASVKSETVGQCTGLTDCNGVKIFEGDVFKRNAYPFVSDGDHNYSGVVVWSDESLAWDYDLYVISDRVRGCAVGGSMHDLMSGDLEVIGNIHDNPELLKGSE